MEVLGENSFENGVLGIVGSYDHAMYLYNNIFYYGEWRIQRFYSTFKGLEARRFSIPISLFFFFFFFFCAKVLNAILNKATEDGDIRGFSICRRGPRIIHIFFANDSLLFCRANLAECEKLQQLLEWYEGALG